jgi:polyhydroxyalkanoate synthase
MTGPEPAIRGPRPLGPHLTAASGILLSSLAALPSARLGSLRWDPSLAPAAESLAARLAKADFGAVSAALGRLVPARLDRFSAGVRLYQQHPYRRQVEEPPTVWRSGSTRLLDYGGRGVPALFVPSLVNRAYILDLSQRRSLMRHLAASGVRPFLLDWGAPDAMEAGYTLTDYVRRLDFALGEVAALAGVPPVLAGYCMGGNLALAAAVRRPGRVAALALLATPWDFHAGTPAAVQLFSPFRLGIGVGLDAARVMPVDMLQLLFLTLDPALGLRKFAAFADLAQDSDAARDFVTLEDWLNDGVPVSGAAAGECLVGWYGDNDPVNLRWRVEGTVIDPRSLPVPSLVVVPEGDRIVPPDSAGALVAGPSALPEPAVLKPPLGHIGMIVGSRAPMLLWQPLTDWILAQGNAKPLSPRRTGGYGARKSRPLKGASP